MPVAPAELTARFKIEGPDEALRRRARGGGAVRHRPRRRAAASS